MHRPTVALVTLFLFLNAHAFAENTKTRGEKMNRFIIQSQAFDAGSRIPKEYTAEGADISPPLAWTGAPAGTKEFALIADDPDAPRPEPWVHWVVYKIPASQTDFKADIPNNEKLEAGILQGVNTNGDTGYGGPLPPRGHGPHHYHFKLYALNASIDLAPGATKEDLLRAMQGKILAASEVIGTYER